MPLLAAVVRLLIGKKQAYASAALKKEDGGSEEQWEKSLAEHGLNLQARWASCQTEVKKPTDNARYRATSQKRT
jgi:hypothetical protein